MKITVEYYDDKITYETSDDASTDDMLSIWENIMRFMTFSPISIKTTIIEKAKEYENSNNE